MRKKVGIIKRNIAIFLIIAMSINSFAALVSDNDGSAFITKAEFDALKSSFQSQIDSYNQSIDSKIDGAIASYLSGIKVSTTEDIPNISYRNYGNNYVKFFSAEQFNKARIAWEEGKNMWWLGWIYLMTNFNQYTAIYCPTFVKGDTTEDPLYPFRNVNQQVTWHAFMGLNPQKNSNYNCLNSPRIIECKTLGNGKYYLDTTACYEFANITNAPFWSNVWIPSAGSAGYRTHTTTSFEGPTQFTSGSQYTNVFSKFTVQEFRWGLATAKWSDVDIAYNKIDIKNEVFLPDYANTFERTIPLVGTGSYIHKQVYNDNYANMDETHYVKWRETGCYFYAKRFDDFKLADHTYQKNDINSRIYEGLRVCNNPNQVGTLEVNFVLAKNKGTKCKIRFKYGPFTNTDKTGNITIKTLDGTAVNANEVEVSSYGTTHKLILELDKNHGDYSDLYAMLIPYNGSSEYVTADAETIEYVQGIKFTGDAFAFTRDN